MPLAVVLALAGCMPSPHEFITTNLDVAQMDDATLAEVGLARKRVGDLQLPDGKVAVADPLTFAEAPPLVRTVAPGAYPVEIIWSDYDQRNAVALLRFGAGRIARWEIAAMPGQDAAALGPADFFPVAVDTGLAMFASSRFAAAFDRRMKLLTRRKKSANYYNDFLARELDGNAEFVMHYPMPEDRAAGAAIIHSGWGDGSYPVLWGLDEQDVPVVLMIDFYVIDDANGVPRSERTLPEQAMRSLNGLMSRLREAAESATSQPKPQ